MNGTFVTYSKTAS